MQSANHKHLKSGLSIRYSYTTQHTLNTTKTSTCIDMVQTLTTIFKYFQTITQCFSNIWVFLQAGGSIQPAFPAHNKFLHTIYSYNYAFIPAWTNA